MSVSCDIIKDLLPLYHDGVCSEDSNKMVEEHLANCKMCNDELKAMAQELSVNEKCSNLSDAEAVKNISKRWKKDMFKSALKGVCSTLITICVVIIILYVFIGIKLA